MGFRSQGFRVYEGTDIGRFRLMSSFSLPLRTPNGGNWCRLPIMENAVL